MKKLESVPANAFIYVPEPLPLAEFDLGGVLYHANYFRLYERAREALLREIDHPYSALVTNGFHLAVVSSEQEFYRPIGYGEAIKIALSVTALRQVSVTFHYQIFATSPAADTCHHQAETKHALVSVQDKSFEVAKFPTALHSALERYLLSVKL